MAAGSSHSAEDAARLERAKVGASSRDADGMPDGNTIARGSMSPPLPDDDADAHTPAARQPSEKKQHHQKQQHPQSYPYARPQSSFVYINGHAFLFDCAAWPAVAKNDLRCGRWLTDLPVRPPAALGWASPRGSGGDGGGEGGGDACAPAATLSVADACARLGFCVRRALELDPDASALAPPGHFAPILAVGSNAGVSQLARKFPPELFPQGVVVPVVRSLLAGFDVAYAPLVTSYGSAPATLHPSPGTRVELYVTHLAPALGRRMHETEGAYNLQRITGAALREGAGLDGGGGGGGGGGVSDGGGGLDGGGHGSDGAGALAGDVADELVATATTVLSYGHQAGTLHVSFARRRAAGGSDGGVGGGGAGEPPPEPHQQTPVALAEIRAHGRRFPALTQRQMLRALRHALHAAEREDGEEGASPGGGSSGASDSSGDADDDAAPLVARPLPVIPHPEDDPELAAVWLGTSEADLDVFLLRCLDCADTRRRRVRRLAAAARPVELAPPMSLEVLATMGTVLSDNVK